MPTAGSDAPLESRWIVAELNATAAKVNLALENYRFDDAANTIYQFFWGSFCDWYLEIVKLSLDFGENADKVRGEDCTYNSGAGLRGVAAVAVAVHAVLD